KKLVISRYAAGDATDATSVAYPLMPEMGSGGQPTSPNGLLLVPKSRCTWSATADPNPVVNGQQPGEGGSLDDRNRRNTTGHGKTSESSPDNWASGPYCGVKTSIRTYEEMDKRRQFNGTWLEIVVDIPPADEYQCDESINRPWEEVNSCWWGIRYEFTGGTG